jgi:hypothetical protein
LGNRECRRPHSRKRRLHHLSGRANYFGPIMPNLRPDHLTGDIADWYWNVLG